MTDSFRDDAVDKAIVDALLEIDQEWAAAEEFIKCAERVRLEAVQPSINELRYAGRRIMDAMQRYRAGTTDDDEQKREFYAYLAEARQFCIRARHDAVDAALLYSADAVKLFETEFGAALMAKHYECYTECKALISEIDTLVVKSRTDRIARDEIYNEICTTKFPTLQEHITRLTGNREALVALYDEQQDGKKQGTRERFIGYVVAAVTGMFVTLFGFWLTEANGNNTASADDEPSPVVEPDTDDQ